MLFIAWNFVTSETHSVPDLAFFGSKLNEGEKSRERKN
jgi:hypothetical protein